MRCTLNLLSLLSLLFLSFGVATAVAITGKVVGPDGKSINGAKLFLVQSDRIKTQELLTDAAGNFSAEVDLTHRLPNRPLAWIVAYASGCVPAETTLEENGNVITLDAGTTISGTVVDPDGKPLAGVPVRLLSLHDEKKFNYRDIYLPEEWRADFTATTAADGVWTLPGIPLTGKMHVALDGDRYQHEAQETVVIAGQMMNAICFTAHLGAVVTGRILTPQGTPAVGAEISISLTDQHNDTTPSYGWGKTTKDGSYHIAGLAPGAYTISVYNETPAWVAEPLSDILLVAGIVNTIPDLCARPGAVVTGRVLTPEGAPVTNAMVRVTATNPTNRTASYSWGRTAADGSYHIAGLARGTYTISAYSEQEAWIAAPLKDIALAEGRETVSPALHTQAGAGLDGTVVDAETGMPIKEQAFIQIFEGNSVDYKAQRTARRIEQNGHFLLRTQPGRVSLLITQPPYGYLALLNTEAVPVDLQEGKTVTVTLKVHKGLIINGTIIDGDGKPAVGMFSFIYVPGRENGDANRSSISLNLTTDQQGHFEVAGLPVGKGTFDRINDSLPDRWTLPAPTAIEVSTKAPITLRLKRLAQYTMTGTVTDNAGLPAAGVKLVYYAQNANQQFNITTDQQGHFEVAGVPEGSGTLQLAATEQSAYPGEWLQPQCWSFDLPAREPIAIIISHQKMHSVSGRVVDISHHPLAGVKVTLFLPKEEGIKRRPTTVTGADGRYTLKKIPGEALVFVYTLEKAGYRQYITGTLTNGDSDTIDDAVMAACTATVRGKVLGADGKPVQGATVVSVEGGLRLRAVTDAAGAFTLAKQPACALHLIAATPTGGGLATCNEHAIDVRITCTPGTHAKPVDVPLVMQLLDADSKRPRPSFNRSAVIRMIADVDVTQAVRLAMSGSEPLDDNLRTFLLVKQAEHDPATVNEILLQLNLLKNPENKFYATVEMGIAVAHSDPELAERLYLNVKPDYDQWEHNSDVVVLLSCLDNPERLSRIVTLSGLLPQTAGLDTMLAGLSQWAKNTETEYFAQLNPRYLEQYMQIITLAGLLQKNADADAMLARWRILTNNTENWNYSTIGSLLNTASRVSPEFVIKVYNSIDNKNKKDTVSWAVSSMVPHDPLGAQKLLKFIDSNNSYDLLPIINALGKKDPAAALALAKASPDDQRSVLLLEAAPYQPKAAADAIIADVFSKEEYRTIWNIAKVNAIDAVLAKSLYMQFKARLDTGDYPIVTRYGMDDSESHEGYAYLISSLDPVEARLILETEFATGLIKAQHGGRPGDLQTIPAAMCALDLKRAQEISEAVGGDNYFLIRYILMSREARVAGPFF